MTIYGYARVSTEGQTLDAQKAQLLEAGATRIFAETMSGASADRAALKRALRMLGEGDVLLVTRLDRLARSTRDLLNVLDAVAKVGAGFNSLADAWADTTTAHGRLMLTVLGGLAEFERELIRARTGEGRKRAKARGVPHGAAGEAQPRPAPRGPGQTRGGGDADRHRPDVRRVSLVHQPASAASVFGATFFTRAGVNSRLSIGLARKNYRGRLRWARSFEGHLGVVRDLFKLQVARRIRPAFFEFSLARLGLQTLSVYGRVAYRPRLPRLAISAAPGKRLPHVDEPKNQRN